MKEEKFYDEHGECVACGRVGVDLHHIKTQGSGGSNENFNLMPLCHPHHVKVHVTGMMKFSKMKKQKDGVDGNAVTEWLLGNDWYIDTFRDKWVNERNFKKEAC